MSKIPYDFILLMFDACIIYNILCTPLLSSTIIQIPVVKNWLLYVQLFYNNIEKVNCTSLLILMRLHSSNLPDNKKINALNHICTSLRRNVQNLCKYSDVEQIYRVNSQEKFKITCKKRIVDIFYTVALNLVFMFQNMQ